MFTQCIEIRSDSIKVDNFIELWSAEVRSWMDDPMQILQKRNHLRKYLSCHNILGRYIHRTYCIEPNLLYLGDRANSAGSIIISLSLLSSFNDSAKLLHCHDGLGCFSSWGISSLTTVPDSIFFPLPLSPQLFLPYFTVTNLGILLFLGKLLSGVSSKFLRDSMNSSYFKKDYSKGEANVVEIAQIRLQKNEEARSYGRFLEEQYFMLL